MGAAAFKVPTEFTAVDKFTSVLKKMGSGVSSFTKTTMAGVSRVNKKIDGLFSGLNRVSQWALGLGAAGLFSMAIQGVTDYETALHSLEAVTGQSASKYSSQIEELASKQKKSVIDIAGGFETVGSAMSQYLNNPKALYDINDAGITLAKAAKMEVQPALESLTSAMNQFNLGSEKAMDTVNRLTAGEIVGSVSTAKSTEQLSKFGAVANSVNVTLPESIALIQTLGKKFTGQMQSEIGNASKNLLLIMDTSSGASKQAQKLLKRNGVSMKVLGDHSLSLGTRLTELSKIQKDGVAMSQVFGRENATAGAVIFDQLATYKDYEKQIETTNAAQKQAAINSDTLSTKVKWLKDSFINAIVTSDEANVSLNAMKSILGWMGDHMPMVIGLVLSLVGAYVVLKAIMIASTIATTAYAIGLGIMGAASGVASIAIGQNTIALTTYKIITGAVTAATWLVTAAQWAWNVALTANPIGLIIMAIAALIALVVAIIAKWDEWGAAVSLFLGPIGLVISIIQSFRKNWDMVKEAFSTDGILGGLKAIGRVLLDAVLMPVQQLLEILSNIPGLSDLAGAGAKEIKEIRESLGVDMGDVDVKSTTKVESPEVANAKVTRENRINGKIDVKIKDKGGNVESVKSSSTGAVPVTVGQTQGAY